MKAGDFESIQKLFDSHAKLNDETGVRHKKFNALLSSEYDTAVLTTLAPCFTFTGQLCFASRIR